MSEVHVRETWLYTAVVWFRVERGGLRDWGLWCRIQDTGLRVYRNYMGTSLIRENNAC